MKTEVAVVLGFVGGVGTTLYLTRNLLKDAVAGRIIVAVEDFMASSVPEKFEPVHAKDYTKPLRKSGRTPWGTDGFKTRQPLNDIMSDRKSAEEVLDGLVRELKDYGSLTIASYYDSVCISSNYEDHKYGWTDLSDAVVLPMDDGYYIKFPDAVLLS